MRFVEYVKQHPKAKHSELANRLIRNSVNNQNINKNFHCYDINGVSKAKIDFFSIIKSGIF